MSENNNNKHLKKHSKGKINDNFDFLNDSFTIPQENFILYNEEINSIIPRKNNTFKTQSNLSSSPTFSTLNSNRKKKFSQSTDIRKKKRKQSKFNNNNNIIKKKKVEFKEKFVEIINIESFKEYNVENFNCKIKKNVHCKCEII